MAKTGVAFDGKVLKLADRIVEFGDGVAEGLEYFTKRVDEVGSSMPEPSRMSKGEAIKSLKNLIKVYKKFRDFSVRTLGQFDSYLLEIKGLYDGAPDESKPELVELFGKVNFGKSEILEAKSNIEKEVYETDLVLREVKNRKIDFRV